MKDKKEGKNKKVNWKNLLDNHCPVCDYEMAIYIAGVFCENPKCEFSLTRQRFNEIKNTQKKLLEKEKLKKFFPPKTGHRQMTIYDKIN